MLTCFRTDNYDPGLGAVTQKHSNEGSETTPAQVANDEKIV
jgi:hypothetical protein